MKKSFMMLASLLMLQTLECEEGGTCQLTDEQLGTLEAKVKELTDAKADALQQIAQRDADIKALKEQLEAKDAEVKAMGAKPAEETKQVTNQGQGATETSPMQDYCNEVREAQEMLNQLKK